MLTEAAAAPNPAQDTATTSLEADNDGYARLNSLLRRFQARHRDEVTVVDLATKVCPTGPPCPAQVDGRNARPDGPPLHADRGDLGGALGTHADLRNPSMTTAVEDDHTGEPDAQRSPPRARWRRLGSGVPAYVPALMIAIGGWQHRWMDEDAFINLRIVDQIFAGHGPVFNAGERVEASTSTVWIAVLVVGRAVFGAFTSMEWIALLASLAAAVGAFALAGKATRLLHRDDRGAVVPVGLLLVAAVAVVWDFSTSGLEMGLVWLWLAASWFVLVSVARSEALPGGKRFGFGVVLGLAARTARPRRDDGLLPRRMVRAGAAAPHRVRPRRDLRPAGRVPDLPHGLLRDGRAHDRARQGRGRAPSRPGLGRTRRTSSGRTACG